MAIYRLGELFCGPGGIACGAINAVCSNAEYGIVHTWANDYDLETCNTYRHNICPHEPNSVVHGDVRQLDFDELDDISALAFGFPCNDFSIVGEQKGVDGTFGPLYQYGVQAINKFHPDWFLAENVGGLKSANEGTAFAKILEDLRNAGNGYRVYPHLYKFEEYGVPQARHRIIIIGIKNELPNEFRPPNPAHYANADVTVRTALANIPEDAMNNELTRQSETATGSGGAPLYCSAA